MAEIGNDFASVFCHHLTWMTKYRSRIETCLMYVAEFKDASS